MSVTAYYAYATMLLSTGHGDLAVAPLQLLRRQQPQSAVVALLLAEAHRSAPARSRTAQARARQQARTILESWLSSADRDAAASASTSEVRARMHLVLGELALAEGRFAVAEQHLITAEPAWPEAALPLGQALLLSGHPARARTALAALGQLMCAWTGLANETSVADEELLARDHWERHLHGWPSSVSSSSLPASPDAEATLSRHFPAVAPSVWARWRRFRPPPCFHLAVLAWHAATWVSHPAAEGAASSDSLQRLHWSGEFRQALNTVRRYRVRGLGEWWNGTAYSLHPRSGAGASGGVVRTLPQPLLSHVVQAAAAARLAFSLGAISLDMNEMDLARLYGLQALDLLPSLQGVRVMLATIAGHDAQDTAVDPLTVEEMRLLRTGLAFHHRKTSRVGEIVEVCSATCSVCVRLSRFVP